MIRFFSHLVLISCTLFLLVTAVLYIALGTPTEESWSFLWQTANHEPPPIAILFALGGIAALFLTFCLMIAFTIREQHATRTLRKIAQPDFLLQKHFSITRTQKKAMTELQELIQTQRSSLQRLAEEKVETNEHLVQERLVAERQRLARELHDSVSQQLFAASMMLSALTEGEEMQAKKQLKQIEHIVQQAQLEMRALLLHLRPVPLHNKTLAEGLEDLIIELQEKAHFHITYQIEHFILSKAEEDHLFRIAQEALSNTLRHARATDIELLFIQRDHLGILRIQDNGRGFNVEEAKTTSYGLRNIAERAIEIGCTYNLVSIVGDGTILEVKVPLKGENLDD